MSTRKIRVGFVGLGHNGMVRLGNHLALGMSEVVALCDCNPERLKAAAVTRSGARTYEDGGIYSDPDVEAISTHTGDPFHRDPFIKAVQAGKHVLIEKPLANTEQDVLDMVMAYDRAVPGLKV